MYFIKTEKEEREEEKEQGENERGVKRTLKN